MQRRVRFFVFFPGAKHAISRSSELSASTIFLFSPPPLLLFAFDRFRVSPRIFGLRRILFAAFIFRFSSALLPKIVYI